MRRLAAVFNSCRAAGWLLCLPLWAASAPLGPFGGSAAIVVADPHSPRTFLAGTRSSMLFRSSDAGESWTPLAFPPQLRDTLNALAIDPQSPGVYLAGLSGELPQDSGMLRSTDGGATWSPVPGLRGRPVRAIAFMRADSKRIAAGTDDGVYLSRDGGLTWALISPEDAQPRPVMSLAFDSKSSSVLYAGTPHLPWKTADGGAAWESIHAGMIDDSDIFSIVVDRNRPERLFAGACSGIYRSLDAGASWTKLVSAPDASYRTYVVVQDPQYENVWFAGTSHGIVRSTDGGATWQTLAHFATRSITFDPGRLGRIIIAADQAGILRSEDNGNTWEAVNQGFCNRRLSSLWTLAGRVFTSSLDAHAGSGVFRLDAEGGNWEETASALVSALLPTAILSTPWLPDIVLASATAGLLVSSDGGVHWNPPPELPAAGPVRALVALDSRWVAAAGPTGVLLSRDGKHWSLCAHPGGDIYDVISLRPRGLLAATTSGLKISEDMGRSWRPLRGDFQSDTVQAICRNPRTGILFAARYGVVYASADVGRSWKRVSPADWSVFSVKQLMVLPDSPDRLLVLTHQQGVWELPLE